MKRRKINNINKLKLKHQNNTKSTSISSSLECSCGLEDVFPEHLPFYLFALVLCVRIYYVLQPRNWWLLHPDEIFQSVEVAFSEVYGYGFRTYEYCPPLLNISTPVEEQEHKQGMYSLRSFIYPQFFAVAFWVCKYLGITNNGYLVGRILQSVVTSSTPIAVYRLCKTMFSCRGVAFLSTILTAFSLHLSVMGTHTLVNSFISPFLFISLDLILKHIIEYPSTKESRTTHQSAGIVKNSNDCLVSSCQMTNDGNGSICDVNSNSKPTKVTNEEKIRSDIEENIMKKTTELKSKKKPRYRNILMLNHKTVYLITSGFVIAMLCYIRPDTAIFVTVFGLSFVFAFADSISVDKLFYMASHIGSGFAVGLLFGGVVDLYTYGNGFLSPIQWTRLNAATNIPAILYGTQSAYQYVFDIFGVCNSELYLNVFFALALLLMMAQSEDTNSRDVKTISSLIITLVVVLVIYSTIGHKEIRFVYNILIVVQILFAYAVHGTLQYVNSKFNLALKTLRIIVIFFSVLIAMNTYFNFPQSQRNIILPWNTVTPSDSSDLNQCLHFIGQRSDVTGVFMDGSIYMTAGYSILNHDVPLITLIHHEYHEYRTGKYIPRSDLIYTAPTHLRVINRYSDIIDVTNHHYLSKRLLESHEYNYVAVAKRRIHFFNRIGFKKDVFRAGRYSVLQRVISREQKEKLIETGHNMTIGQNATILEYEASWLYTAGLYNKSIERLEHAINISDKRIRPFQILGASYANLADFTRAKETDDKCYIRHGRTACREPQPRIVIHEDYNAYDMKRQK